MTIEDPTAIPENDDQFKEYLEAAGQAFEHDDNDRARTLYHALSQSHYDGPDFPLVAYRLAVIHLAAGETDDAYRWARQSTHPGAADLLRSIDNATPDEPVDPNRVPETFEEATSYVVQAQHAFDTGDLATAEALYGVLVQCTALPPGGLGHCQIRYGAILIQQGRNDDARAWIESGLPVADATYAAEARRLLQQIGIHVSDGGNPYETEGSKHLVDGITAFERGDGAAAQQELLAAYQSDSSTSEDRARAAYYLGSMAVAAHDYDTARTYLDEAAASAPATEQAWAAQLLASRWQEATP